ncbi:MAG: hypothetical protein LC634_05465 [Sphingomonadales bacterium]|nr:hypothetical protein [Sphingomonadales bacterium]
MTIDLSSLMTSGQAWVGDNTVVPIFVEVANNGAGLTIVDATGVKRGGVSVSDASVAHLSEQGDRFVGTDGQDFAYGGGGDDTLYGHLGGDSLYGDAGDDLIFGDGPSANPGGSLLDDELHGGTGNDTINGAAGDDTLFGDQDDDLLSGGSGNDVLDGDMGNDTLYGDQGDDRLNGGHQSDVISGGAGDDTIDGGTSDDVAVYGGNASDYDVSIVEGNYLIVDNRAGSPDGTDIVGNVETLRFADQDMVIDANSSNLTAEVVAVNALTLKVVLSGSAARSGTDKLVTMETRLSEGASVSYHTYLIDNGVVPLEIFVTAKKYKIIDARGVTGAGVSVGGDTVYLTEQGDELRGARVGYGYGGDDTMNGGIFADTLDGGEGHDGLYGHEGNDVLRGGEGNDLLMAGAGDDDMHGGFGNDTIDGETGHDTIFGDDGSDRIFGRGGDDHVFGGTGDDLIFGDAGNDIMSGDEGNDTIDGGAGDDIVRFSGNRDEYVITQVGNAILVDGGSNNDDGADTLTNVELLRFADQDVSAAALGKLSAMPHQPIFDALSPIEMIA